jgi:hypothetical protein
MHAEMTTSLATLAALGAFHGINPGMGWLFAVALGMQERRRAAVVRALVPLGAGHALAVAAAVAVALVLGAAVPLQWIRALVGVGLIGLGLARAVRHRHPRWASMRVGMLGLTLWSFLMATAHGAGLMVVPVFVGMSMPDGGPQCHHALQAGNVWTALAATGVHAAGYLAMTGFLALLIFERLGVGVLRRAWVNLDGVWAAALIVTGALTLWL